MIAQICSRGALLPCLWVALLSCSQFSQAEPVRAALILPEASGAAALIYQKVAEGVRSNKQLEIKTVTLNSESTAEEIDQAIAQHQSKLVIAVGNKSYKLSKSLNTDALIVAGGISGKPNGIPMVSLTAAPEQTLAELRELAPNINSIHIVYNQAINGWWYEQALVAAKKYDIEVIGYQAETLKAGVKMYETLFAKAEPSTSAVWIPLRSIVPSKTILPLVLEKAWSKKLAVISNNPSHTKLGGLLALYPEHTAMGAQLALFALNHLEGKEQLPIVGVERLRMSINLRTSAHIDLRINKRDQDRFDKIFPTKR